MNYQQHWQLDPNLDFLNHGSFGAVPNVVLTEQRALQDALERDPIEFLAPERSLHPKLDHVRGVLAEFVGADPADLVFVRNATDGVNAVLNSVPLQSGDEILVTSHGYNACTNAAHHAASRWGAVVRTAEIPFPLVGVDDVLDAIDAGITQRTRLLLIDHVTSPTGIVFPIADMVEMAHHRNVRVLVDGAHAPGMLPLNLNSLGADYYTANHHKWLCGPKVSGFLWVAADRQTEVRPTVISHAANRPQSGRSRFTCEFDWTGTHDPTPLLAMPRAIEFLGSLMEGGMQAVIDHNHHTAIAARDLLTEALGIEKPVPDAMLGSLVAVPLPVTSPTTSPFTSLSSQASVLPARWSSLQRRLREQHRFELPVYVGPVADAGSVGDVGSVGDSWLLRVSLQVYNHLTQIERLADVLREELKAG